MLCGAVPVTSVSMYPSQGKLTEILRGRVVSKGNIFNINLNQNFQRSEGNSN